MFHYNRIMVQLQQPLLRSDNDRIKHKIRASFFDFISYCKTTEYGITPQILFVNEVEIFLLNYNMHFFSFQ